MRRRQDRGATHAHTHNFLRRKPTPPQHGADLESGALELAVTGSAFKMLQHAGRAAPLLYNTRIFARVKPEGKVRRRRGGAATPVTDPLFLAPHGPHSPSPPPPPLAPHSDPRR